jgi:hypothetical protein
MTAAAARRPPYDLFFPECDVILWVAGPYLPPTLLHQGDAASAAPLQPQHCCIAPLKHVHVTVHYSTRDA